MTQAQRIARSAQHAWLRYLNKQDGSIKEIQTYYAAAHRDIQNRLLEEPAITDFTRERLTALDIHIQGRINELQPYVERGTRNALEIGYRDGLDAGYRQAALGHGKTVAQLRAEWFTFVPRGIEQYTHYGLQLCREYNAELVYRIQNTLRLGFIERKAWSEIITDIRRKAFGFAPRERIPKGHHGATWKIKRMVRTEMQRMRTMARNEVMEFDRDIIGVTIVQGEGPCPDGVCYALAGDYMKDGSGKGWPPPNLPEDSHPNCFDKDTEVYTDSGWKLFGELDGEKILSLNPATHEIDFLNYIHRVAYPYKGEMSHYTNNCFDLMVTPNHNHYVDCGKGWEIRQDKDLPKKVKFFRGCSWRGQEIENVIIGALKIPVDVFCAFMGYYLSDGCVTRLKTKNGYRDKWQITIAKDKVKKPELRKKVEGTLNQIPGVTWWGTQGGLLTTNDDLAKYCLQYGKASEKYVPQEIKVLTSDKIRIFLDAYASCDGHIRKTVYKGKEGNFKDERTYFTSSKKMADDLGELVLKAGYRPSFSVYPTKGVTVEHRNGIYAGNHDIYVVRQCSKLTASKVYKKSISYNDMVYDVELPKWHVLLVRRNGKVVWSGNCLCYDYFIYPTVEEYPLR